MLRGMNTSIRSLTLALTLAASLVGIAATAGAQTVITSVPYTISTPGHYALGGNLNSNTANTPAITINAPNVILDLSGYYVAGPYNTAANGDQNSTIYVGDVANVTIRNGLIAGDAYGINFSSGNLANSRNYLVDTVTITHCYLEGIHFNESAAGSQVKNCSFSLIGNSTITGSVSPAAIYSNGGVRIENNNIGSVTATGTGKSYGINGYTGDFMIGNTISGCYYGISDGKYANNLFYDVTSTVTNGTDAGGNN